MEAIHLDEDWDPDKYDKEMEQMFNDDYFEGGRTGFTIYPSIHLFNINKNCK